MVGADLLPVGTNTPRARPGRQAAHGGFVRLVQQVHQGRPGAGDAGADRADRAVADLGRFRVGQAEDLGEEERLAALVRQAIQQVEQRDAVVEAGQTGGWAVRPPPASRGTSDSRGRAAAYR